MKVVLKMYNYMDVQIIDSCHMMQTQSNHRYILNMIPISLHLQLKVEILLYRNMLEEAFPSNLCSMQNMITSEIITLPQ